MATNKQLDLNSNLTLKPAMTWDEALEKNFPAVPVADLFGKNKVVIFGLPGAFTGVCSGKHVPNYLAHVDDFKAKGVDTVICTAVNDPYTLNAWAVKLGAKDKLMFYSDFDASFHKSLDLTIDLSKAFMGLRSKRWAGLIEDGKLLACNVEDDPSNYDKSKAERILEIL
jgi:peroxiredoxin